ncbi:MAG: cobaltochelatase subunit CobN [Oceanococcaceae bacterium]
MQAKALAGSRVFGGLNGEYGTAIMGLVERGDRWQEPSQIAQTYLNNMGASYGSSERWMQHSPKLFAAVLEGTDALVQPRDSNTWGALSLDHVYEFMGGLSRAIEEVNGEGVEAYFDDFRQPGRPKVSSLEETISIESRATVLNPDYLKGLAAGGASSAGVLAEITRNAYGWESMRPETIPERYWHEFMDMVVRDREQLGLQAFFERENPYALQEITAVMLETARKGLWQASPEQVAELAERHAQNVAEFGPSCTGFTCGNRALKAFIEQALEAGAARAYAQSIDAQVLGTQASAGVVLRKDSAAPTVLAQGENNSRHSSAGPTPEEARAADRSLPLRVLGLGGFAFVLLAGLLLARRRRPA